MKRLIRPLVYILGFSVFFACTTTKMTPIEDVSASAEVSDLSLTLTDGTKLAVTAANIGLDFVRGTITEADTRRVAAYFESWQSRRIASTTDDALAGGWAGYEVAIPRSDILDVQNRKVSVLRTVLFVVGVPVAVVLVAAVVFAATWDGPFGDLDN